MEVDSPTVSRSRRKTFTLQSSRQQSAPTKRPVDVCNMTFISQPEDPLSQGSTNGGVILIDDAMQGNVGRPVGVHVEEEDLRNDVTSSAIMQCWSLDNVDNPRFQCTQKIKDFTQLTNIKDNLVHCGDAGEVELLQYVSELEYAGAINRPSNDVDSSNQIDLEVSAKSEELFEMTVRRPTDGIAANHTPTTFTTSNSEKGKLRFEREKLNDELQKLSNRLNFLPASKSKEIQKFQAEVKVIEEMYEENKSRDKGYRKEVEKIYKEIETQGILYKDVYSKVGLLRQVPSSLLKLTDKYVCQDKRFCDNFSKTPSCTFASDSNVGPVLPCDKNI